MTEARRNWSPEDPDIQAAFPAIDAGVEPFGERVLVQIRTPKRYSEGGILLHDETRETELWNTQVGKNRDTLQPWPEGDWCKVGEFVRVPKYGGDRWEVPIPGTKDKAHFVIFKDHSLIGRQISHPLRIIAFL